MSTEIETFFRMIHPVPRSDSLLLIPINDVD